MPKKERLQNTIAYPPRAMRVEEAAAYLSLSRSAFLRLVDERIMPPPIKIHRVATWDRLQLDAAFENLKDRPENTIDQALQNWRNAN